MESVSRAKTIREIADEAGVSVATVSRYLNDSDKVSEKAQKKIRFIVEKYNYKPNQIAKHLSLQKTETFGLIIPDVTNPFFAEIARSVEHAAIERGYAVMICNTLNDFQLEQRYLNDLTDRRVDGLIFMGGSVNNTELTDGIKDDIQKILNKTSVVMIDGAIEGVEHIALISDIKTAMQTIFKHLYDLGHTEITFMGGLHDVSTFISKMDTYIALMEQFDLDDKIEVLATGFSFMDGYSSMKHFIRDRNLPTAIICINDIFAAGVIRACHEAGIVVPEEISVVSFDNTEYCEMTTPTLTSIGINYSNLGQMVVEALLDTSIPSMQFMDMKLAVRGSSGLCQRREGDMTKV